MKLTKVAVLAFCFSIKLMASNTYEELTNLKLIANGDAPSLHLGCGDVHLNGYVNIDFPKENRGLQKGGAADYYGDLRLLRFPTKSVGKIENHHVFEHFSRPQSLALLCAWHTWLVDGGALVIETPDFDSAIERYLNTKSFKDKQVIIRHLFGSHEADWAVHWDGWGLEKFRHILTALGFSFESARCFAWQATDNIEVSVKKIKHYTLPELRSIAKELFELSKVDKTEVGMGLKWLSDFNQALDLMVLE
jgi:predicted SAM-dependent methyltransferase